MSTRDPEVVELGDIPRPAKIIIDISYWLYSAGCRELFSGSPETEEELYDSLQILG